MTEGGAYALSPDCRTRPHRSRRWVQAPYAIPRAPQPPTYGLRVRTIGASAAVSILPADIAVTAVRNSSFRLSATANDDPDDAAICGFHTGCGLIIRRLKKKGPTRQFDNARFRFVARNLLQRNDFRVGRRGLEPRTYGL